MPEGGGGVVIPAKLSPDAVDTVSMQDIATVQSVDSAARTVTLKLSDGSTHVYKCGPEVRNFDQIHAGV